AKRERERAYAWDQREHGVFDWQWLHTQLSSPLPRALPRAPAGARPLAALRNPTLQHSSFRTDMHERWPVLIADPESPVRQGHNGLGVGAGRVGTQRCALQIEGRLYIACP